MMIMGAPNRYIQGPGLIDRVGEIIGQLGDRFFLFGDQTALPLYGDRLVRSLQDMHKSYRVETFRGECCYPEIFRLSGEAQAHDTHVIMGLGGGKTADTAKAVSIQSGRPLVIIPTIASTDAPTSHVAIIYDENHVIKEVLRMKPNPFLVLVDTQIIAEAPPRYLVAGMVDAMSTKFEAEACWKSGAQNVFGGSPTQAALYLSQMAYEIIRESGEEAVASVARKEVTAALERVVEANILLSGLGFESGGLAAAHAVEAGLSGIDELHLSLHGERVAYGILVHLVLENRGSEELQDIMGFYRGLGLPTSLRQLGLKDSSTETIEKAVELICREESLIHHMPFEIDRRMVAESITKVEALADE